MGKQSSSKTKPTPTGKAIPTNSTTSTSTSIDDIFASSSKNTTTTNKLSTQSHSKIQGKSKKESTSLSTISKKKKFHSETTNSEKTKNVETVLDPSTFGGDNTLVDGSVRISAGNGKGRGKRDRKDLEEEAVFRDSRGDGPRRKTEEGFLIFKEAELGINPEAGGTPLCPFDCDCCF